MTTLLFDIEATGLLRKGSQMHCLVMRDMADPDEVRVFDCRKTQSIEMGVEQLKRADVLTGHNIISYDLELLKELFADFSFSGQILDTLVLSRLFYPHLKERDFERQPEGLPIGLYGSHSLKAWGYRLKCYKGEFGANEGDWSVYTPEMLNYCIQDTEVNTKLYQLLMRRVEEINPDCVSLEMRMAELMSIQERSGFRFDTTAASEVRQELQEEFDSLSAQMKSRFAFVPDKVFTPKRTTKTNGYVAGAPMTKLKEFNPTSRQNIAWALQNHRGARFTKTTDSGKAKVDEASLSEMRDVALQQGNDQLKQECDAFIKLLSLQKYLGQLSEGSNSWYNSIEDDGCIHHSCILATQTGRNVHRGPNLGQVVSAPWARKLFIPHPGMVMVGCDLEGIELRCLGHFLAKYDGGSFADVVVNGDIHQQNADRVGCSRREVKTLTYAFIYGAGDLKLGHSLKPELSDARKKALGSELRRKFLDAIPGLEPLVDAVKSTVRHKEKLRGLDGRTIYITTEHAGLNYLLQSSAAVISKRWCVISQELLDQAGLTYDIDYTRCAYVHDEQQFSVVESEAERVSELLVKAAPLAGDYYNFRVPITASADIGKTWAETH